MTFKPMLATDFREPLLKFPYFATPKLDGIRCLAFEEGAKTRSLKPFPNRHVDQFFRTHAAALSHLDGELIVGDPNAKDVYNQTASGLMRFDGKPAFTFLVFDMMDATGAIPFRRRAKAAQMVIEAAKDVPNVMWLESMLVENMAELLRYEEAALGMGFEGVMLRHPEGRYKQGRATVNENLLLKVKRTTDAEAVVVRLDEQMHNTNAATKNELGRTKRSSAKAGLVGKGTTGALIVRGAPGQPFEGIEFGIGSGMDDTLRAALWQRRGQIAGLTVRYRFLDIGTKDAPRHPVFAGFRSEGT
jgi:DNA ligase-1